MRTKIGFKHKSIHHTAFATSNLEETIRYWRDLLGFKLLLGLGNEDQKQYFFGLSDSFMIAFFEWRDVLPVPPKHHGEPAKGPFIFDHIAIEMESRQDLYRLQDQLIESGFPVSDIIDHGFAHSIYTHDPNGIPLEFMIPVAGVSLFHEPRIADAKAPEAAMEGFDPAPHHWPNVEAETQEDIDRTTIPGDGHELFNK